MLPLYAADVLVSPGDPIPGDVEGTVLLLAGAHETFDTVEITKSLTLTAEPGAIWTSHADPAIAVHADDVTISNLVLQSANPTATAIVSGSPVTLVQPSHRVTCESNKIEGFVSGILNAYGDGFIARNNEITGVEAPLDPLESDTVGILNTMGSDAIIEGNQITGFFDGIFFSGSHGRAQGNRISRTNVGIYSCNWPLPVAGEPDFFFDLVPNNAGNYWDIHSNEITDGIQIPGYFDLEIPVWGILMMDGANHNLVQGNVITGVTDAIALLGANSPWASFGLFPESHENVVIANPGEVVENFGDDPDPTFGNVLIGIESVDEAGMALWQDVLMNAGPRTESAAEDFSNVFFTSLSAGLNMIDVPLKPVIPYTARSLADDIGATTVIRYNTVQRRFEGYTPGNSGPGFLIPGGSGVIVNVTESKTVSFVGAAWTNDPPVDLAPPAKAHTSAWAFVLSGSLDNANAADTGYTVKVTNQRTGETVSDTISPDGTFAAVAADLSRRSVVESGDTLETVVQDAYGRTVSGPYTWEITSGAIRQAYLHVILPSRERIPQKAALLQNYPNPFNPETWIPYHLAEGADVSVRIHDTTGRLVRTLALGHKEVGMYVSKHEAAYWDGKSDMGEEVASGVYFYTMQAGQFTTTRKMIIAK